MIYRNGLGAADGVILLAGYVHSDPALSAYTDQVYVAALDRGFWPTRPLDTIGILLNYQHVSDQLATEQALDRSSTCPSPMAPPGFRPRKKTSRSTTISTSLAA